MSMSFGSAFATLSVGDSASVSNGLPEPSKVGGTPWKAWRSHNFTGQLVEKIEEAPRRMVFRLAQEGDARVSYTIIEGLGHSFTAGA